ncbi:MAG: NAD(P)/FAD-dependent oxidoreductase, partial [bacterium]
SLQARTCVAGKWMLYDYCRERGIPHRNCGKLIVATSEEEAGKLLGIQARAAANGVPDLRLLTAEEARVMEPALVCTAALHSPSTGIIDSHAYMLSLQGDAESAGAVFAFHAPVLAGRVSNRGVEIEVGGAEPMRLSAR